MRKQVNLRMSEALLDKLDAEAARRGTSRNALIVELASRQLAADEWREATNHPVSNTFTSATEVTRGHLHKLVEVPDTRSPGRLLGTTEATFECVCGKSERRKVG